MEPLYTPEGVEERWQRTWEEEGLYETEPDPGRDSYVYCFPPPNVTGELHLGMRSSSRSGTRSCG